MERAPEAVSGTNSPESPSAWVCRVYWVGPTGPVPKSGHVGACVPAARAAANKFLSQSQAPDSRSCLILFAGEKLARSSLPLARTPRRARAPPFQQGFLSNPLTVTHVQVIANALSSSSEASPRLTAVVIPGGFLLPTSQSSASPFPRSAAPPMAGRVPR